MGALPGRPRGAVRPRWRAATVRALLVCAGLGVATGCPGRAVDLSEALEITEVTTGWFDAGIVDGKNKLVPTISFHLRNAGNRRLGAIQINAIFRRVGEEEEWGNAFAPAVPGGLDPGETAGPVVLRSSLGYTGEQPRAEMLQHGLFHDAQVELFARHRSPAWTRLGEFVIERQLLTQ
jgi:hypothetical protein